MTNPPRPLATKAVDIILLLFLIIALVLLAKGTTSDEPTVVRFRSLPAAAEPPTAAPAEVIPPAPGVDAPAAGCCKDGCKAPKKCINCVCTLPATDRPKIDLGAQHYLIWDYGPQRPGTPLPDSVFLDATPSP